MWNESRRELGVWIGSSEDKWMIIFNWLMQYKSSLFLIFLVLFVESSLGLLRSVDCKNFLQGKFGESRSGSENFSYDFASCVDTMSNGEGDWVWVRLEVGVNVFSLFFLVLGPLLKSLSLADMEINLVNSLFGVFDFSLSCRHSYSMLMHEPTLAEGGFARRIVDILRQWYSIRRVG